MTTEGFVHGFEIDAKHALYIFQGSILRVPADAIVSSDDNELSAGGGVSAAIARAGGRDLRAEYRRLVAGRRPEVGDVVRTSGGALPCRYVYHAITIDYERGIDVDEPSLRRLVAGLLAQASQDGICTLALPAIGTGVAQFDLARASEVIIEELVARLVETSIERVVVALLGDDAQRLFYERLVRAQAERCAITALRDRERHGPAATVAPSLATPILADSCEQFPSLVDESRLAAQGDGGPRLVAGLVELVLRHASPEDIERELLALPAYQRFRGSLAQRLAEFLYHSEANLRIALGPALFRSKELRAMLEELHGDATFARDHDQLIDAVLRILCFNLVTPPCGITQYLVEADRLLADLDRAGNDSRHVTTIAMEAGKLVEQVLSDLLRLYAHLFWGTDGERELVTRALVAARRDGDALAKLTIGQARQALGQLESIVAGDPGLRVTLDSLGRTTRDLLPKRIRVHSSTAELDTQKALQVIIELRNSASHTRDGTSGGQAPDAITTRDAVETLRAFLGKCSSERFYPEVLRYDGTFENRDGERFVHFIDEQGRDRKVRTDVRIDPRRHYYCFATNNPIYLYPVLVPKR